MARTSTEPPAASASSSGLLPTTIVAPLPIWARVVLTITAAEIVPLVPEAPDVVPAATRATERSRVRASTTRLSARSVTPSSIRAWVLLPYQKNPRLPPAAEALGGASEFTPSLLIDHMLALRPPIALGVLKLPARLIAWLTLSAVTLTVWLPVRKFAVFRTPSASWLTSAPDWIVAAAVWESTRTVTVPASVFFWPLLADCAQESKRLSSRPPLSLM